MKLIPIILIIFAASSRLLPHPANFAPISAMALFGGVYLSWKYAFIIPLLALFISDLFLGFYGKTMLFVYGSFIISGFLGIWLRTHKGFSFVIGCSLISSILFYLITNFGVWLDPVSWYPKNIFGLMQSYTAGIPFFRGTILGDLFYTFSIFGLYELGLRLSKKYLPAKVSEKFV